MQLIMLIAYNYYTNFDLKITIKKYEKANKMAIYLSISLNVVKIQQIKKIIVLQCFFDFLSEFTVYFVVNSYEYNNKKGENYE